MHCVCCVVRCAGCVWASLLSRFVSTLSLLFPKHSASHVVLSALADIVGDVDDDDSNTSSREFMSEVRLISDATKNVGKGHNNILCSIRTRTLYYIQSIYPTNHTTNHPSIRLSILIPHFLLRLCRRSFPHSAPVDRNEGRRLRPSTTAVAAAMARAIEITMREMNSFSCTFVESTFPNKRDSIYTKRKCFSRAERSEKREREAEGRKNSSAYELFKKKRMQYSTSLVRV